MDSIEVIKVNRWRQGIGSVGNAKLRNGLVPLGRQQVPSERGICSAGRPNRATRTEIPNARSAKNAPAD